MGHLDLKIREIELQLRAKNDGCMPDIPVPMDKQLSEFLEGSATVRAGPAKNGIKLQQ